MRLTWGAFLREPGRCCGSMAFDRVNGQGPFMQPHHGLYQRQPEPCSGILLGVMVLKLFERFHGFDDAFSAHANTGVRYD